MFFRARVDSNASSDSSARSAKGFTLKLWNLFGALSTPSTPATLSGNSSLSNDVSSHRSSHSRKDSKAKKKTKAKLKKGRVSKKSKSKSSKKKSKETVNGLPTDEAQCPENITSPKPTKQSILENSIIQQQAKKIEPSTVKPAVLAPILQDLDESTDSIKVIESQEAEELIQANVNHTESNDNQNNEEIVIVKSDKKRKKRYKRYERSKRRLIINPSSESEQSRASDSSGVQPENVVELVPSGSLLYHSLQDSMISALMEERSHLEEELKKQSESKPLEETSVTSFADKPSTAREVTSQVSSPNPKDTPQNASNPLQKTLQDKQPKKWAINVKQIRMTGLEELGLRRAASSSSVEKKLIQDIPTHCGPISHSPVLEKAAIDKSLLHKPNLKATLTSTDSRQESLPQQHYALNSGAQVSVSSKMPIQKNLEPILVSTPRSNMVVTPEENAFGEISSSSAEYSDVPLLTIASKRSKLNKKRKLKSRVAYRNSIRNERLPLKEVLDATILKETIGKGSTLDDASSYLKTFDILEYIQPSLNSILPPDQGCQLQSTSTPSKTKDNVRLINSFQAEEDSSRVIKSSSITNGGLRHVQSETYDSQESQNLLINAQAFVATRFRKVERPASDKSKLGGMSNLTADGSQYFTPSTPVRLTPGELSFSYIQEPTGTDVRVMDIASKNRLSPEAILNGWLSSQSRVLFDSNTVIPQTSQSNRSNSQKSVGGSQIIGVESQIFSGESQPSNPANMQKGSDDAVNSSFDTSSLTKKLQTGNRLRHIQITPMSVCEQVRWHYEQARHNFDGPNKSPGSE